MINAHNEIMPAREAVFYVPRYQFFIRILLGISTLIYFYFLPLPMLALNRYILFLVVFVYLAFHAIWWHRFRRKGVSFPGIRLANWVDLIGGGIAVTIDPYAIPPTLLLILIIVLGNGIQHGLKNFIITSQNTAVLSFLFIPLHFYLCGQWPPYNFYFLAVLVLVCVHYSYNLIQRIEYLKSQAEDLAQVDELTGMMNRRAFLNTARYLISLYDRVQMPLVLVFADLDGLKQVNDVLGHAIGDQVLKGFASIVMQNFRKADIAARYGGDEFVFILTNSDRKNAEKVFSRLEALFIDWAKMNHVKVGISYGIKEIRGASVDLAEAIRAADAALYESKRMKKKIQK